VWLLFASKQHSHVVDSSFAGQITCPSGRGLRVVTGAFWDMDEWQSGMNLYAKAYAEAGWRRWFPYRAWRCRGAPGDRSRCHLSLQPR